MAEQIPTFKLVLVGDGGTGKASHLDIRTPYPEPSNYIPIIRVLTMR